MTLTMLVVLLCVGGACALVTPDGWRARMMLRRGRGAAPVGSWRAGAGSDSASRTPSRVGPVVMGAVDGLGRAIRSRASRRPDPAADRRLGVAVAVAVVVVLVGGLLVAVPFAGAAWAAPVFRSRSRRRAHERRIRSVLPDVVDLFRLAVGSGLSVHQTVDVVAARAPAPVDAVLEEVRRRVGLGARLGDALDALDQLGDPALPLAAALRSSARYGAPLGVALERAAADARVLRRRRAEEEARRLPIQLLFPLVVCVLPAFGLLAVVPLVLASLHSLQL